MGEGIIGRESSKGESRADRLFKVSSVSQSSYKPVMCIEVARILGDRGTETLDRARSIAFRKLVERAMGEFFRPGSFRFTHDTL